MLVPVKSFGVAKARLADVLPPHIRSLLARWMATRVVHAVQPLAVFVACDDDGVAAWAEEIGAHVLWGPGLGLNGAVDHGVATIAGKGFDRVLISHGDLPLPEPLPDLLDADEGRIVLVPDRRRDGTNVIVRPCSVELPASYGGGSFRRHLVHALASGLPVTVRPDVRLSIDLDTLTDLEHPLVRPVVAPIVAPDAALFGASNAPDPPGVEDGAPQ